MKKNSHHLNSDIFSALDPRIQKWIWKKGWSNLRGIQKLAIRSVLGSDKDIIISANTSGGKTEAAFFPVVSDILSKVKEKNIKEGVVALYVSPMKALINDQYDRLEDMCRGLYIKVLPWHGDVGYFLKKKGLEGDPCIILMTPESLESFFINRGFFLKEKFFHLSYFIIDELHAFLGSERGKQLQSLMYRIEDVLGHRVRRIGLSATLGDMRSAARYLRQNEEVDILCSKDGGRELKVKVTAQEEEVPPATKGRVRREIIEKKKNDVVHDIAESIYQHLRGECNLVFINSRHYVEEYTKILQKKCQEKRVPNEFHAHHGLLSKMERERVEHLLKTSAKPISIICTSTLELGIDVGYVHSVAQVGAPFSVAGLRQRLGRSGRRPYDPAILRIFVAVRDVSDDTFLPQRLHKELFQSIAMIRLLVRGWYEPPSQENLHLSTLIQQIVSVVEQKSGVTALELYEILCKRGAFKITQKDFILLLKCLAHSDNDILMGTSDGRILLAPKGEDIVKNYDFYAVFQTKQEFRLMQGKKSLGQYLISGPLLKGMNIYFSGKVWKILNIEKKERILSVDTTKNTSNLVYRPCHGALNTGVLREMFRLYCEKDPLPFVDEKAQEYILRGRAEFALYQLKDSWFVEADGGLIFFPWSGARVFNTLLLYFHSKGLGVAQISDLAMIIDASYDEILLALKAYPKDISLIELAHDVQNKERKKYDHFLSEELLEKDYAHASLDQHYTYELVSHILSGKSPEDILRKI